MALFGSNELSQAAPADEPRNEFSRLARKRVAHLTQKFRARWEKEFLPAIGRADQNQPRKRVVQLGDVVLVTEGEQDRQRWKLGRIVRVHPTGDGVPRIVDVKMGSGEIRCNRAVGNMAVLDVGESSTSLTTASTRGRMSHSQ
jgi:hypothetical protein